MTIQDWWDATIGIVFVLVMVAIAFLAVYVIK